MLTLYHAPDLETLSELVMGLLAQPQKDPLAPAQLIVPSQGMGRWLTLQLARRQGIVMQLEMQLPSAFIWSLSRIVLGELPEQSAFNPTNLGWRLYGWLHDPSNLEQVPRLARYLKDCDERRRMALAAKIADVFDQYLLYRDDWLAAWERKELLNLGPDEEWQALLWRELTRDGHPHRARLLESLLTRLFDDTPIPGLPERLAVFGISSLPNHHLRVLEGLARHIDVVLFAINPTREAWGDIRDVREQARQSGNALLSPDDWYLEIGNPLLASLGKQGRDFFDSLFSLVNDSNGNEQGFYDEDLVDHSLLRALQNDILCLRTRTPEARIPLRPDDRSLEIHIAHSALREVEILHDQLLARFQADPELSPDQVVVLTPDIEAYAPFIEAVFAPRKGGPYIPYSLADRGLRAEVPLIESFLELLALPESRFTAEEILTWLHQPAIARRANIEAEELPLLRQWLQEAGVRWGRDEAHRAHLKLPADAAFSWRQGLDRLLLGFAAPPQLAKQQAPLLGGHWPLDALEGARGQLLGRLVSFVEHLGYFADQLARPRPLADWADSLQQLIDSLFDEQEAAETLLQLSQACAALREQAQISQLQLPIPLELVRQQLTKALDSSEGSTGFLTGMVTFCTMVPMRSLPFKLICLLGLNDGAFPRRTPAAGFDLIARQPRRGDRTRRLDDRYLLLEALMSARQALYLSYVGRSPRDNAPLPPSVLINELLEAVDLTAITQDPKQPASQQISHQHPLQPFSPRNFASAAHSGFAKPWFNAAQRLAALAQPAEAFATQLSPPEGGLTLEPQQLIRCLQHPARFFLEQRLNLRLPDAQATISLDEPFDMERPARRGVLQLALSAQEQHWSAEEEYQLARSAGWLPTGALGQAHWGSLRAPVLAFAPKLFAARPQEHPAPILVNIPQSDLLNLRIYGWLDGVTSQGLFSWKLSAPGEWDKTAFWLRHLLLNISAPAGVHCESQLLSPQQHWRLSPINKEESLSLLLPWLQACQRAFQSPLPLFTRSSYAFAKALQPSSNSKKDPQQAARDNARTCWEGNEHMAGEQQDAWNALAFRDRPALDEHFEQLAEHLLSPVLERLP